MKKIMLFASALAGMFFAASCQQENLEPVQMGNSVKFTVEAPGAMNTKAIADGKNVNEVHYAVYKTNAGVDYSIHNHGTAVTDGPLAQGVVPMSNKKATIDFDLLQDQDYTVIFWAQVADAGHYNLGDLRTIEVTTSVAGNDETRAAFYARYDFSTYEHKDHEVTLRRPFAQLNLLTTAESLTPVQTGQTTGYTIDVKASEVVVTGLSTTFNTLTGLAPAGDETFVFEMAATPEEPVENGGLGQETLVVNGKAYHYVSMNYFFVPEDEKLVDIKYTVSTDKGDIKNEIVSVPVKENYRTNVIGNLLTKESTFEIVVDANFYGQELVQVWDGREVSMPFVNEAGEYEISFASELAWLAAAVNGTLPVTEMEQIESDAPQGFKGVTFKLVEDIDLEGALWTPIGNHSYDRMFAGTFDGNGHIISNLVVNNADNAGLFGELCGATIKNVTIENFNLTADHYAGAIVGWVEVGATPTFVQNCIVRKGEITVNVNDKDLGDKAGSIVGFAHGGTYTNNTASEVVIKGYRDLGGIAGHLQSNGVVSNNKVNNVTIIADQTPEYAEVKAANAGKFVGRTAGNASVTENFEENVTVQIINCADSDLVTAINNAKDGDTIYFAGTYGTFPAIGKDLTVICEEGTTFQGNSKLNLNTEAVVIGATFSNPSGTAVDQTITGTFKNCTFTGSNALRWAYAGEVCVFEDCVFDGAVYGVHFDGGTDKEVYYKNCVFSGFNAWAGAIKLLTFDGCKFQPNGKSNYNGANLWGSAKFINTEFTFDGSVEYEWIDAIGADKTYEFTGCTINGGTILSSYYFGSRNEDTDITIDGTLYEDFSKNAYIACAKDMFWFAEQVNAEGKSFSGKTVKLTANVDLANAAWTPVGQTGATTFNGVFDGQNYTISNLYVNSEDKTGAYYSSGLFGWVETHSEGKGHIKNVKINGATVVGHHNCGALVGYITEKYAVVDNCHVSNATISCTYANGDADGDKAGALIGNATNATKVNRCSAVDCTVSAGRDSGQLIGAAKSDNVTDCSATNVTVSANGTGTGKNIRNEVIGRLL